MLLALREPFGYRPIMVVQDIKTSPQNTTYVTGIAEADRGFMNDPIGVFLRLLTPLYNQTMEWDQMKFTPIDPEQAWDMQWNRGQMVFPFELYKAANLTLLGIRTMLPGNMYCLEFRENPFPLFIDNVE